MGHESSSVVVPRHPTLHPNPSSVCVHFALKWVVESLLFLPDGERVCGETALGVAVVDTDRGWTGDLRRVVNDAGGGAWKGGGSGGGRGRAAI
jgi:hypothetical protein